MPKPRRRRPARRRDQPFQPLRTLAQIFVLQTTFYLVAVLLILFTAVVAGQPFSPDLVFSWRSVRGDTTVGWTLGLVWLLTGLFMVIAQTVIITRSKLVLDFTATLHFIHFLVVSLWEHEIPRGMLWWALQGVSFLGMTALSTWACRWRELRPMTFGLGTGDYELVERRGGVEEIGLVSGDPEREGEGGGGRAGGGAV
ncbi:hypothetical protein EX30DRAFT_333155 [Ascodesmis nigricans]|uniref:Integral membrane protein n=1 Tax=Ascodesmis nigricans TaxID=341454 RepID=A0A4S2MT07_9PEZI|nr:hypothetical protein EX30DRAFT_333155 [Ascodesmis nigricans]